MFKIIPFQPKYRDDMIFCLLAAKDALGKAPRLSEDLLDIQGNYFDQNDMFWIAVNDNDRVVGMIGTNTVSATDMWLKRLYVKPEMKRKGIASSLLAAVEDYAQAKGITTLHTRFSDDYTEAPRFYAAKGFMEVGHGDGARHLVKTI